MTRELFGTDEQRSMLARGADFYELIRNDPRFTYYGRNVGLCNVKTSSPAQLAALTRLQGASACAVLSPSDLPEWQRDLELNDLSVTRYARWSAAADGMAAARHIRNSIAIPADLTLHRIDHASPAETVKKLAEVALSCGVLPIAGAVLRGLSRPGTGFIALDQGGQPVACAAAAAYYHADHNSAQCWWGMLATAPSHRGQGLALRLGAEALLDMNARFGFTGVFTGVSPGNGASETVCKRMGLELEYDMVISVADPAQLSGGRMTK